MKKLTCTYLCARLYKEFRSMLLTFLIRTQNSLLRCGRKLKNLFLQDTEKLITYTNPGSRGVLVYRLCRNTYWIFSHIQRSFTAMDGSVPRPLKEYQLCLSSFAGTLLFWRHQTVLQNEFETSWCLLEPTGGGGKHSEKMVKHPQICWR